MKASTAAMPTKYGHSNFESSRNPPNAAIMAHSPTAKLMIPVGRIMSR
jgi:hypothetical protein